MTTTASIVEQLRQLRLDAVASELAAATSVVTERAALEHAQSFVAGFQSGALRFMSLHPGGLYWAVKRECEDIELAINQRLADISPAAHLEHLREPGRNAPEELL